jgi:hypothetical protein
MRNFKKITGKIAENPTSTAAVYPRIVIQPIFPWAAHRDLPAEPGKTSRRASVRIFLRFAVGGTSALVKYNDTVGIGP